MKNAQKRKSKKSSSDILGFFGVVAKESSGTGAILSYTLFASIVGGAMLVYLALILLVLNYPNLLSHLGLESLLQYFMYGLHNDAYYRLLELHGELRSPLSGHEFVERYFRFYVATLLIVGALVVSQIVMLVMLDLNALRKAWRIRPLPVPDNRDLLIGIYLVLLVFGLWQTFNSPNNVEYTPGLSNGFTLNGGFFKIVYMQSLMIGIISMSVPGLYVFTIGKDTSDEVKPGE